MSETFQFCGSDARRQLVAGSGTIMPGGLKLNGIDFLEVVDDQSQAKADKQRFVNVTFLNEDGLFNGPLAAIEPHQIHISGGVRIQHIRVLNVTVSGVKSLQLELSEAGDFSPYELRLQVNSTNTDPLPNMDRLLSCMPFFFKVGCPSEFDCANTEPLPPIRESGPALDYQARDYEGYRTLMLDRMANTIPQWQERNPADLGVALVEVLADAADKTSWFQDAIGTEAFFDRARMRQSLLRHARLLGFNASDGSNARVAISLQVATDRTQAEPILAKGTRLLSQVANSAAEPIIQPEPELFERYINAGSVVFETMTPVYSVHQAQNQMVLHDWGQEPCCLARGATDAYLIGTVASLGLERGDLLVFEETFPIGGTLQDPPNIEHRQLVRLSETPVNVFDPVLAKDVVHIQWFAEDSLQFDLNMGRSEGRAGSIVSGNVVLADQGRTINYGLSAGEAAEDGIAVGSAEDKGVLPDDGPGQRVRLRLDCSQLVYAKPFDPETALSRPAIAIFNQVEAATPSVFLVGDGQLWNPTQDLLRSDRFATDFKVEPRDGDGAYILFGDGSAGRAPDDGTDFTAIIRHSDGVTNLPNDSIKHIIITDNTLITSVRNPIAASGATHPQGNASIRLNAPNSFRKQRRAVTAADYVNAAEQFSDVQRARAIRRWTGSWYTIFLAVDRRGGLLVEPSFERDLRAFLSSQRLAGHDLEIVSPKYVALDISLFVCLEKDHYASDVLTDLYQRFSSSYYGAGQAAFFNPDRFTFGDNIFLSRIIADAMEVEGVRWIGMTNNDDKLVGNFRRLDQPNIDYHLEGEIPIEQGEIAQLENDPNFPDRGRLNFQVSGGR